MRNEANADGEAETGGRHACNSIHPDAYVNLPAPKLGGGNDHCRECRHSGVQERWVERAQSCARSREMIEKRG